MAFEPSLTALFFIFARAFVRGGVFSRGRLTGGWEKEEGKKAPTVN